MIAIRTDQTGNDHYVFRLWFPWIGYVYGSFVVRQTLSKRDRKRALTTPRSIIRMSR